MRSVIFALLMLVTGTVWAEQFPRLFPDPPLTLNQEVTEARNIHYECTRILALIPRLSPAEDVWLQGEIQAQRDIPNLMLRPEYNRHTLFIYFTDCAIQTEVVMESKNIRQRAAAWARMVSRFSSGYGLKYWADHAGVPALQESVKRFSAWTDLSTYKILDGVVIPYLDGAAGTIQY